MKPRRSKQTRKVLFGFGTLTIKLIQGVGVVTRATISRRSKSSKVSQKFTNAKRYSARRVLNWVHFFIQLHVIFARKFTNSITENRRKFFDQLVSGQSRLGSGQNRLGWCIMRIHVTIRGLGMIQLVIVQVLDAFYSKTSFP